MLNKPPQVKLLPTSLREWLMLSLVFGTWLWMMSGCSVVVTPLKPPLSQVPGERPALVDEYGALGKDGRAWIQELVNAYLRNCITLKVLRGEDPQLCEKGLR